MLSFQKENKEKKKEKKMAGGGSVAFIVITIILLVALIAAVIVLFITKGSKNTTSGPRGFQGFTGSSGGAGGPQGRVGSQGPQARDGTNGTNGPQGLSGTGGLGPRGPQGLTGALPGGTVSGQVLITAADVAHDAPPDDQVNFLAPNTIQQAIANFTTVGKVTTLTCHGLQFRPNAPAKSCKFTITGGPGFPLIQSPSTNAIIGWVGTLDAHQNVRTSQTGTGGASALLVGCRAITINGTPSTNQFQLFFSTDGASFFTPTPPDFFGAIMFPSFAIQYQNA